MIRCRSSRSGRREINKRGWFYYERESEIKCCQKVAETGDFRTYCDVCVIKSFDWLRKLRSSADQGAPTAAIGDYTDGLVFLSHVGKGGIDAESD